MGKKNEERIITFNDTSNNLIDLMQDWLKISTLPDEVLDFTEPDWDGLEEYIALSTEKFADSMPLDIRQWTAIQEQYNLIVGLLNGKLVSAVNKNELRNEISKIVREQYKNSIIELFTDASETHLTIFYDFGFSKFIVELLRYSNAILPHVHRIAATTIANDLVSVTPLPSPEGLMYFDGAFESDQWKTIDENSISLQHENDKSSSSSTSNKLGRKGPGRKTQNR